MTNLDTNVLLRSILMDDPAQSPLAAALIEELTTERPGFVSVVALLEVVWALTRIYKFTREQTAQTVQALLETAEIRLEAAEAVTQALRLFLPSTVSFSDCLLFSAGGAARCEATVTFDQQAARELGMRLLS